MPSARLRSKLAQYRLEPGPPTPDQRKHSSLSPIGSERGSRGYHGAEDG